MQELLETLIINPYSTSFIILILFMVLGLVLCLLSLSFARPKVYLYAAGSLLSVSTLFITIIADIIVLHKQQDAIHDIKAHAIKEGNVIRIHSESRWLKDGQFEIVGENDDHYFVKVDHVIEIKKIEIGEK